MKKMFISRYAGILLTCLAILLCSIAAIFGPLAIQRANGPLVQVIGILLLVLFCAYAASLYSQYQGFESRYENARWLTTQLNVPRHLQAGAIALLLDGKRIPATYMEATYSNSLC